MDATLAEIEAAAHTANIDSEYEALIQEASKCVMAGRMSIVIAHRLSTILAADLI